MTPPPGAERKPWGWTLPLGSRGETGTDGLRLLVRDARIYVDPGGYSSIHHHRGQSNTFHVLSGRLQVTEYVIQDGAPVQVAKQVLAEDEAYTVPAGRLHRFLALSPVEALEVYVATKDGEAYGGDIHRFTENGCDPAMAELHG
jgi:mannose-6-phosphate isomerase-like protein (cupin superfamily)